MHRITRIAVLAAVAAALVSCGGGEDSTPTIDARALAAVVEYGPADATDAERAAVVESVVTVCENAAKGFGGRFAMAESVADSPLLGDVFGDVCPDALALALED